MSSGHLLCVDRNGMKSANEFAHLSVPAGVLDILRMSVKQRPKRSVDQIPRPKGRGI